MPEPASSIATGLALEAGKQALEQKRRENQRVNEKLLERASETPGFRQAVDLYGERQAQKQAVYRGLFSPIVKFSEMVEKRFGPEILPPLSERLEQIPEQDLQSPKPSVALPALEGLSLSLDEPNLKQLYIELLGTASDSRVAPTAHPSFVSVLKQLTSEEAALLPLILGSTMLAVVRLDRVETATAAFRTVHSHVIPFLNSSSGEPDVYPYLGTWVDNWIRLGLVTVDHTVHVEGEEGYSWVATRPEFLYAQRLYDTETHKVTYKAGVLEVTTYGKQFALAVGLEVSKA